MRHQPKGTFTRSARLAFLVKTLVTFLTAQVWPVTRWLADETHLMPS